MEVDWDKDGGNWATRACERGRDEAQVGMQDSHEEEGSARRDIKKRDGCRRGIWIAWSYRLENTYDNGGRVVLLGREMASICIRPRFSCTQLGKAWDAKTEVSNSTQIKKWQRG